MIKTKYISEKRSLSSLHFQIDDELASLARNNSRFISVQYSVAYEGKDDFGRSRHLYEALIVYEDNK